MKERINPRKQENKVSRGKKRKEVKREGGRPPGTVEEGQKWKYKKKK